MKKIISGIAVIAFTFISLCGPAVSVEAQVDSTASLASNAKGAMAPVTTSDRISLDLKGMDVVEVIKMLATKGGLNIILSADVKGRVTIFLKNVGIIDALEIILTANGLAYDRRGEIIYVMSQREYEAIYGEKYAERKEAKIFHLKYAKASDASKALNQMKTKIGKIVVDDGSNTIVVMDSPATIYEIGKAIKAIDMPTVTKVFELKYARASDIKQKVTDVLTKGVGSVQIDERTNKVAVTDLERRMVDIERMVTAFDDKLQQVLIEAKIIQITLDDNFKLGVDWQSVIKKAGQISKDINIVSAFQLAASNAFGPPGAQLIIGSLGETDWGTMIQILKTVGDTDLLSSPRITALNNQEAKIMIGTSQPYATNTVTQTTGLATTATNLTFIDIGVKLYVTPTINKDGFVTMRIRPEVSSTTTNYTYGTPATTVPVVETTQAETSVTVKDGTTIIIGGLIKDQRKSSVNKIPILGDVPVLGAAFRQTIDQIIKQELVVFLTPHIITGDYDILEQPKTYPIGEKGFTMSESPTFERRNPIEISPGMFKEKKTWPDWSKSHKQETSGKVVINTPEDYFYILKSKILGKIRLPEGKKISMKGSVKLTFVLSPKGELRSGPEIIKSSNSALSGPAIDAVKKAAPFPSFPESMGPVEQRFNIDISNQKGELDE
ncbi:MAG: secretin N-terminal domain-containing protein [Candidatus Omnitrophota bacterium]